MTALTLDQAASLSTRRDLTAAELADALEVWADSREYHASRDGVPHLLDGVILLRQAARRIRWQG